MVYLFSWINNDVLGQMASFKKPLHLPVWGFVIIIGFNIWAIPIAKLIFCH